MVVPEHNVSLLGSTLTKNEPSHGFIVMLDLFFYPCPSVCVCMFLYMVDRRKCVVHL